MEKLVSIILPTYNGAQRIERAIQSVFDQSFTLWELLVINDGSTDATREIVEGFVNKDPRIRYLKNEKNLGVQQSLNKGIALSAGEYIARIDDDDAWIDKNKLKRQVAFLEDNADHVLVGTGVVVVDAEGKELFNYLLPTTDEAIRENMLSKNCFAHSSVLFRRIAVMHAGGYSEAKEALHIEDYDLWLKLGLSGKLANLPVYGIKWALRRNSLSSHHKIEQFRKSISLIRKYKAIYPNYFFAMVKSYLRVVLYSLILRSPFKNSLNKILKWYKALW
jgi:glycosyltransferase involved in cell wall biosynthesis